MKQRKFRVFDVLFTAGCFLLVMLYLAYSEQIQHFLTLKLVIPYLSKTSIILNYNNPQQTFLSWAIYLLIATIIALPLLRYILIHRKRRYPRAIIWSVSLGVFFYLFHRLGTSPWLFYPTAHFFKYIDFVGISSLLFVFFAIKVRLRVTPYKKSSTILLSLINHRTITNIIKATQEKTTKILQIINSKTIAKLKITIAKQNEVLSNEIDYLDIDSTNGFSFDNPVNESKYNNSDLLNFSNISINVAEKIRNTFNPHSAFTIGITGEWGSGKTSFLNILKGDLEKYYDDKRIIIEFSPWKNHNEKTIITDFFDTLGGELSKYDYNIESKLQEYAKMLVDADVDIVTKYAKTIKSFITNQKSVSNVYEEIDLRIKSIGYQIIIFIDDIDRLYKKEILETLKLIRNSAAFGNVVFIAAYSKLYVESNIQDEIKAADGFLSKIFQLEFALPINDESVYADYFINLIKHINIEDNELKIIEGLKKTTSNSNNNFSYSLKNDTKSYYNFFSKENFKSIRELNQFANQFICSYLTLNSRCFAVDLLLIEYVHFKYPLIYNELSLISDYKLTQLHNLPSVKLLSEKKQEYILVILRTLLLHEKTIDNRSIVIPENSSMYFKKNS